ncbi:WXG100 family type VII secretion target [Bacillus fengqiuensis]|nr:WXG100 family type VII secretion target [Bacillus fengqiuensis]
MSRILVSPDQLQQVSRLFVQTQGEFARLNAQLQRNIDMLQVNWQGAAREGFYQKFQQSQVQMKRFEEHVLAVGKDLERIAVKFKQEDAKQVTKGHSNSEPAKKESLLDKTFTFLENAGKWAITAQGVVAIGLIGGKHIKIAEKAAHTGRAVIHAAPWVKGQGNNNFLKKVASKMDKSIRSPGMAMKTVKSIDNFITKTTGIQVSGLGKAKSFQHWTKNILVGVEEGKNGIKTREISGMISKRVFKSGLLSVGFTVAEEGTGLWKEHKKGSLTGKDWAVAASNTTIKAGAGAAGAFIGGAAIGAFAGPGGAVVGAFVGGMAGSWAGDALAGVAKDAILEGPKKALEHAADDAKKKIRQGFSWIKGKFK